MRNYKKANVLEQGQEWEKWLEKEAEDRACRALKARFRSLASFKNNVHLKGFGGGEVA